MTNLHTHSQDSDPFFHLNAALREMSSGISAMQNKRDRDEQYPSFEERIARSREERTLSDLVEGVLAKHDAAQEIFSGILCVLDVPTRKPPSGARGHRVILRRSVAEKALRSLLNKPLKCIPSLDGHDGAHCVGVITDAVIVRDRLMVSGFINSLNRRALQKWGAGQVLGMSYEVTDAAVKDPRARVWDLQEVTFEGAAVLREDKAAMGGTEFRWAGLYRDSVSGLLMCPDGHVEPNQESGL